MDDIGLDCTYVRRSHKERHHALSGSSLILLLDAAAALPLPACVEVLGGLCGDQQAVPLETAAGGLV
jgi:hypothetical protein